MGKQCSQKQPIFHLKSEISIQAQQSDQNGDAYLRGRLWGKKVGVGGFGHERELTCLLSCLFC